jgi:hypothetical protein
LERNLCGIGRPFLVEHTPRLAAPVARDDWQRATSFDVSGLTPSDLNELAEYWTRVGLLEHASVAAFARFQLQLLEFGAPPQLVDACTQAQRDEARHAKLCFGIASQFRGAPVGPGRLATRGALEALSLGELVELVFLEGCVGETVAAAQAAEACRRAEPRELKIALSGIASDESQHAALAWRFVQWAIEQEPALAALLEQLVDACEAEARTDAEAPQAESPLASHGLLGERTEDAIRRQALGNVVVPCGRQLFTSQAKAA